MHTFLSQIDLKAILLLCVLFELSFASELTAQQPDQTYDSIAAYVLLDSVVVSAVAKGLEVKDFIRIMQTDESLYRAFRKVRTLPYSGTYQMTFYDKKGLAEASFLGKGVQRCHADCCVHEIVEQWDFGDFYDRRGDHNYYTSSMFSQLFLKEDTFCYDKLEDVQKTIQNEPQAHERYLKQLIFQPGTAVDVPWVGQKTEIFGLRHFEKYHFSLQLEEKDSISYFVFSCTLKEEQKDELPIQFLETWFTSEDLHIVERHFHIKENAWLYDVDLTIDIQLQKFGDDHIPAELRYNGSWDIPGNPAERCNFLIQIQPDREKIRE